MPYHLKSRLRDKHGRKLIAESYYTCSTANAHLHLASTVENWKFLIGQEVDVDYSFEEILVSREIPWLEWDRWITFTLPNWKQWHWEEELCSN